VLSIADAVQCENWLALLLAGKQMNQQNIVSRPKNISTPEVIRKKEQAKQLRELEKP